MPLTCSNCGNELPDDAKFCGECGTPVAVQEKKLNYCANCFAEMPENTKFCLQCGKPAVVACAYHNPPDRDQSILDELLATSPEQINYRAYEMAHNAWEKHPLEYEEPVLNLNDVVDFERNKTKIVKRTWQWIEYETSRRERIHWFQELCIGGIRGAAEHSWIDETLWFRTNKPNHHKALFFEKFIERYLYELRQQLAFTYDDPPQPTPLFLDYLRKVRSYTEEDIQEFELELPNMAEIKRWPQKDDELFPPPQPVQVEAAGGIISFTIDEAVVVVYLDCLYKGKEILLESMRNEELYVRQQKAIVIERTVGNTPICVAIFHPVLFVTDEMKNREKVVNQVKMEMSASWSASDETSPDEVWKLSNEDKVMWFSSREEFILFKGDVKQIDWRGRRGKVERKYNR